MKKNRVTITLIILGVLSYAVLRGVPQDIIVNGDGVLTNTSTVQITTDGVIGFIGCSMTINAVDGYKKYGGEKIWQDVVMEDYSGGGITRLVNFDKDSHYWNAFQEALNKNPDTTAIWWELCTAERMNKTDTYDNALLVLQEIHRRVGELPVYVSAQPMYTDGHVCKIAGEDGPKNMQDFVDKMVTEGVATVGPVIGPLSAELVSDGCHANEKGKLLMGKQVEVFFDN